ncbi:hypothetical protein SCMC78_04220 [Streptomyces sp. CMC78]|uniref:Uncharacterized protein n=1 Tax=Streptomyces sp. CMC78 TaxID=3231512 RepID=A0AB33K8X4_9ACTN
MTAVGSGDVRRLNPQGRRARGGRVPGAFEPGADGGPGPPNLCAACTGTRRRRGRHACTGPPGLRTARTGPPRVRRDAVPPRPGLTARRGQPLPVSMAVIRSEAALASRAGSPPSSTAVM